MEADVTRLPFEDDQFGLVLSFRAARSHSPFVTTYQAVYAKSEAPATTDGVVAGIG
jgi:hypothetical protein